MEQLTVQCWGGGGGGGFGSYFDGYYYAGGGGGGGAYAFDIYDTLLSGTYSYLIVRGGMVTCRRKYNLELRRCPRYLCDRWRRRWR